MQDHFNIVLVSNASPELFPQNTTTSFQTELARRITLTHEYECALLEIQLPSTISNVIDGENSVTLLGDKPLTLKIPPGYYANPKILIDTFNRILKEKKICEHDFFTLQSDGVVKTNACKKNASRILSLCETLRRQLGLYKNKIDLTESIHGSWPADPEIGSPSQIFVYCDFVSPQLIGHTLAPVLRIIPVKKGQIFATTYSHSVENPVYVDVSTRQLTHAEVYLRDHAGKPISFQFGQASLLVHFRKRV